MSGEWKEVPESEIAQFFQPVEKAWQETPESEIPSEFLQEHEKLMQELEPPKEEGVLDKVKKAVVNSPFYQTYFGKEPGDMSPVSDSTQAVTSSLPATKEAVNRAIQQTPIGQTTKEGNDYFYPGTGVPLAQQEARSLTAGQEAQAIKQDEELLQATTDPYTASQVEGSAAERLTPGKALGRLAQKAGDVIPPGATRIVANVGNFANSVGVGMGRFAAELDSAVGLPSDVQAARHAEAIQKLRGPESTGQAYGVEKEFEDIVANTALVLPFIPGGVLKGAAALGFGKALEEIPTGMNSGLSLGQATTRSALLGTAEFLGEAVGLHGATQLIEQAFKKGGERAAFEELQKLWVNNAMEQGGGEALTEALQLGTDALPVIGLNPNISPDKAVEQIFDSFVQGASQAVLMGLPANLGAAYSLADEEGRKHELEYATQAWRDRPGEIALDLAEKTDYAPWVPEVLTRLEKLPDQDPMVAFEYRRQRDEYEKLLKGREVIPQEEGEKTSPDLTLEAAQHQAEMNNRWTPFSVPKDELPLGFLPYDTLMRQFDAQKEQETTQQKPLYKAMKEVLAGTGPIVHPFKYGELKQESLLPEEEPQEKKGKDAWEMTQAEYRQTLPVAERWADNEELNKRIEAKVGSRDPQAILKYYKKRYPNELRGVSVEVREVPTPSGAQSAVFSEEDFDVTRVITLQKPTKPQAGVKDFSTPSILRHELEHALDWARELVQAKERIPTSSELQGGVSTFRHYDHAHFSSDYMHHALVAEALQEGKEVTLRVLADYPDLLMQSAAVKDKTSKEHPAAVALLGDIFTHTPEAFQLVAGNSLRRKIGQPEVQVNLPEIAQKSVKYALKRYSTTKDVDAFKFVGNKAAGAKDFLRARLVNSLGIFSSMVAHVAGPKSNFVIHEIVPVLKKPFGEFASEMSPQERKEYMTVLLLRTLLGQDTDTFTMGRTVLSGKIFYLAHSERYLPDFERDPGEIIKELKKFEQRRNEKGYFFTPTAEEEFYAAKRIANLSSDQIKKLVQESVTRFKLPKTTTMEWWSWLDVRKRLMEKYYATWQAPEVSQEVKLQGALDVLEIHKELAPETHFAGIRDTLAGAGILQFGSWAEKPLAESAGEGTGETFVPLSDFTPGFPRMGAWAFEEKVQQKWGQEQLQKVREELQKLLTLPKIDFSITPTLVEFGKDLRVLSSSVEEFSKRLVGALGAQARKIAKRLWDHIGKGIMAAAILALASNVNFEVTYKEATQLFNQIKAYELPTPQLQALRLLVEEKKPSLEIVQEAAASIEVGKPEINWAEEEAKGEAEVQEVFKWALKGTKDAIPDPTTDDSKYWKHIAQLVKEKGASTPMEKAWEMYWEKEGNNPKVQKVLDLVGLRGGQDKIAWCAPFVSYTQTLAGNPMKLVSARQFLKQGGKVALDQAQPGDIVVMWNTNAATGGKTGWGGHVGYFLKQRGDFLWLLGGNQGDRVNVSVFHKDRVLGVRRLGDTSQTPINTQVTLPEAENTFTLDEALPGLDIAFLGMFWRRRSPEEIIKVGGGVVPSMAAAFRKVGVFSSKEEKELNLSLDRFHAFHKLFQSTFANLSQNTHAPGVLEFLRGLMAYNTTHMANVRVWDELAKEANQLSRGKKLQLEGYFEEIRRMDHVPDANEKMIIASRHGLSATAVGTSLTGEPAIEVAEKLFRQLAEALNQVEDVWIAEATRVLTKDTSKLPPLKAAIVRQENAQEIAKAVAKIKEKMDAYRKVPYMPAARFGTHVLLIRDSRDKVVFNMQWGSPLIPSRVTEKYLKGLQLSLIKDKFHSAPGYYGTIYEVPEEIRQYNGMPYYVIEQLKQGLKLTKEQEDVFNEKVLGKLPGESYLQHFRRSGKIPGYDPDWVRQIAAYGQRHSAYIARATHDWELANAVGLLKRSTKNARKGINSVSSPRTRLISYMEGLRVYLMNPRAEFDGLKSVIAFLTFLGKPISLVVEGLLVPMGTWGYVTSVFGQGALPEIVKANKSAVGQLLHPGKGSVARQAGLFKAVEQAQDENLLGESFSIDLAGFAEGGTLSLLTSSNVVMATWKRLLWASGAPMRWGDRAARHTSFQVMWQLMMRAQEEGGLKPLVEEYRKLLFHKYGEDIWKLVQTGWSPYEATAYYAAKEAVLSVHGNFAKWNRPYPIRGSYTGLFLFLKNFMMQRAWALNPFAHEEYTTTYYDKNGDLHVQRIRNPMGEAALKNLLISVVLAGLWGGLPGGDDLRKLMEIFLLHAQKEGWVEHGTVNGKVREYLTGMGLGNWADSLLHGISYSSFGLAGLGKYLHLKGIPEVDLSTNLSMGQLLPGDPLGEILKWQQGTQDGGEMIANTLLNLFGVGFGEVDKLGSALLNDSMTGVFSLHDLQNDPGLWMKEHGGLLPAALKYAADAGVNAVTGRETLPGGGSLRYNEEPVSFDWTEPKDAATLLFRAMGARPTKISMAQEQRQELKAVQMFYEVRKEHLKKLLNHARNIVDLESVAKIKEDIASYNKGVPFPTMRITQEEIGEGREAHKQAMKLKELGYGPGEEGKQLGRSVITRQGWEPVEEKREPAPKGR